MAVMTTVGILSLEWLFFFPNRVWKSKRKRRFFHIRNFRTFLHRTPYCPRGPPVPHGCTWLVLWLLSAPVCPAPLPCGCVDVPWPRNRARISLGFVFVCGVVCWEQQ